MEYFSVKEAAERWGISDRRVRFLCRQGRVPGVAREGRTYLIPRNAVKPADGRTLRGMVIPTEYSALLSGVDALKAELDRRRPLTQGEVERLQREFIAEFTYNSNAIEGNTLTLQETALVMKGLTVDGKPLRDHLEAVGHRDAYLYVQQLVSTKTLITEKVIREIHSLVLVDKPEDRGVYRSIPVRITGSRHESPQPFLVPVQMEKIIRTLYKGRRHPIEKAASFHLDFEGVHPFVDGNGRTGRLILNLMLMQCGYPPINVKFSDRKRYYDCFDAYYENNTASPMVKLVAGNLEERLRQYLSLLE